MNKIAIFQLKQLRFSQLSALTSSTVAFTTGIRLAIILLSAVLLGACSRTVTWEEEVPLNTGESIVVTRSGTYYFHYDAGSGFIGYSPKLDSTIEFTHKGKKYSHRGEARINLVAIDPNGVPSLVADARGWGNYNKYPCVTPYYVQFKPDETGTQWRWPNQIEPWLYNLPTNLLVGLSKIEDDGKKLKPKDRMRLNGSLLSMNHYLRIDPLFKPENCIKRN